MLYDSEYNAVQPDGPFLTAKPLCRSLQRLKMRTQLHSFEETLSISVPIQGGNLDDVPWWLVMGDRR